MPHYNFIASNKPYKEDISVERFVESYPGFQSVFLKDDQEFLLLLSLIGMTEINHRKLNNPCFRHCWDISNYFFPEINEEEFDKVYNRWISLTNRESDMDEYGNVNFLIGKTRAWNKLKYRYVVKEINEAL